MNNYYLVIESSVFVVQVIVQEACSSSANRVKPLYSTIHTVPLLFKSLSKANDLHDVGVIIKLYFAIFVAFKESMTLNLAHRSLRSYDFI